MLHETLLVWKSTSDPSFRWDSLIRMRTILIAWTFNPPRNLERVTHRNAVIQGFSWRWWKSPPKVPSQPQWPSTCLQCSHYLACAPLHAWAELLTDAPHAAHSFAFLSCRSSDGCHWKTLINGIRTYFSLCSLCIGRHNVWEWRWVKYTVNENGGWVKYPLRGA